MRKKIIALLLAALTVFSAGCTASAPSSADESTPVITAKSKEKRKIIIDTDTAGDDAVAMIIAAFRGFGRGCECAVPCGGAERRESYRHHGRRQQGHPQRRSADHKVGFMLKPITPDGVKKQLKKLRYPIGGLE